MRQMVAQKGPSSLDTRYIYEDVPNGLGLLENLSAELGFESPIASALITLAGALKNTDYRRTMRTLQSLGVTLPELRQLTGTNCHGGDPGQESHWRPCIALHGPTERGTDQKAILGVTGQAGGCRTAP